MRTSIKSSVLGTYFDEALLENLERYGQFKRYEKSDVIIDVGQIITEVPILLNGKIKVISEHEEGHEMLIYTLEKGDTCAMSLTCCVGNTKSRVRAIAGTNDTEIIMIRFEHMAKWYHDSESWRLFILQSYQTRFNEMIETIDTLAFLKMDKRLYKYLIDRVKLTSNASLELTHKEIAEDMNTSRVVISRLLKQMENEGKILLGRNNIKVLEYL